MLDRRSNNIAIFENTLRLIGESDFLKEAVTHSIDNQKIYPESDEITISSETYATDCMILGSKKRSFEAAKPYAKAGKKVCVLNFASSVNPGGGVSNGANAQEECLCRCSTLYPCLTVEKMENRFYLPHKALANTLYNDDAIFTPGVYVIKTDTAAPERMEDTDWYQVDVIACAAPNIKKVPEELLIRMEGRRSAILDTGKLQALFEQRIDRIFRIAIANGAEVLILGAFGCGAFMNPPEVVAPAFRNVQKKYGRYFDTIEYAVYCSEYDEENYLTFCDMLGFEKETDLSRFLRMHDRDYSKALSEIRGGRKMSHWIWYIFPQIQGLGASQTAREYAIEDMREAKAYIQHPILRAHMLEISEALLQLSGNNATAVMGYPDDIKLKSSMTLFAEADPDCPVFQQVLDKYFHGYKDEKTLAKLNGKG